MSLGHPGAFFLVASIPLAFDHSPRLVRRNARPAAAPLHRRPAGVRPVPACPAEPAAALVVPRSGRRPGRVERSRCSSARAHAPVAHAGDRAAQAALRSGVRPHVDLSVLGLVLAAGVRHRVSDRRAAVASPTRSTCLLGWSRRDTYTLGFGPFPIVLSTNLFLWFKAGLVLSAVPDDRGRVRCQGIHPVEQGRAPGAHLQSVVVHADDLLARAHSDGHERHHLGPGHRHHAVLSARTCTCSSSWLRCRGNSCSA